MGNKLIFCTFAIIFLIINFNNATKKNFIENELLLILNNKEKKEYNFVAHAGGGYNGKTYTNSINAVENSISKGFKLIELDLLITNDNYVIGSHDWKSFRNLCKKYLSYKVSYSYEEFKLCNDNLDQKLIDQFYIFNILNKDKQDQLRILTDQSQNFKILHKIFYPYEGKIIIEAHNIKNYLKAKFYFPMVALTFNDGRRYKYFVKFFRLNLIIIKSSLVDKYKDTLAELLQKNKIVFSYTTNEEKFIIKNLDKYVNIFYTDFWNFNNDECEEKIKDTANNSPCHTY